MLNEGHTYRDIAIIDHTSPNEIARIRREKTGETTKHDVDMKSKSICSQVFVLLQGGITLPQIVIDQDIEPEQVLKIQEKYLNLVNKGKIVSLLIDQKDMTLIINLLQYLVENPHHHRKLWTL